MEAEGKKKAVFHFFQQETLVLFISYCLIVTLAVIAASGFSGADGTPVNENIKININKASLEQLLFLKGIGLERARAILARRTEVGPFKSALDIQSINGISVDLAKEIESQVVFE